VQRRRLGLVLGGGGVRGLAHTGVLQTLVANDIAPDVVVGVSMGAVVAATYACREDWQDALLAVDRSRLPAFVLPEDGEEESLVRLRSALRSARRLAPSVWTWGRQGYEEYGRATLRALLGEGASFDTARLPLAVVATDLAGGGRIVLRDGDLVGATLASAAIPGIAKPVTVDGRQLIDGGFADPAPVDVARDLGADVVVAVHAGQHLTPNDADNWMTALVRGLEIAQRAFAEERLNDADLVLRPDYGQRINVLNFGVVDSVVRHGAACAAAAVDDIKALLEPA
jgi:NTE family protein